MIGCVFDVRNSANVLSDLSCRRLQEPRVAPRSGALSNVYGFSMPLPQLPVIQVRKHVPSSWYNNHLYHTRGVSYQLISFSSSDCRQALSTIFACLVRPRTLHPDRRKVLSPGHWSGFFYQEDPSLFRLFDSELPVQRRRLFRALENIPQRKAEVWKLNSRCCSCIVKFIS